MNGLTQPLRLVIKLYCFRCGRKKGEVAALLRHIEGRVASIEQRKNDLVDEIQLAVDMVCVCRE